MQPRTIDDVLNAYKAETRRRKFSEHCYFIQRHSDNLIKIGYSSHVQNRSFGITTEVKSSVTVLGIIKGGLVLEKLLHTMFKPLHITGEWYEPKAELLQYIAANAEKYVQSKRKERVPKERKPRRPQVNRRARRVETLKTRLKNPKDFVRQRAITTLGIEFRQEAFPILREHQAQETSRRVREWVDIIIEMVERHELPKAA